MPVAEEVKSSWADEVEEEGGALPPSTETVHNGYKVITEYKYNEDNKKVGKKSKEIPNKIIWFNLFLN